MWRWLTAILFLATIITSPPVVAQDTCRIHIKFYEGRLASDMGDGLLGGDLEVRLLIGVYSDTFIGQRAYPAEGYVQMSGEDTFRLEDFTFSMRAAPQIDIGIFAVEIDNARLLGVDLGNGAEVLATTARDSLGFFGSAIGWVFERGSNIIAGNDVITDDVIILRETSNWNAGRPITYRTVDGGLELGYYVALSGCR